MNAWERIQSDHEVDRSQIYPVPCKRGLSLCNNAGLMSFIFTAFLWICRSMFVFCGFTDLVSLAVCFLAGSEVLCFVS